MSDTHTSSSGTGPVSAATGDRRRLVERAIAALNAHDTAAFAATYSPDAVVHTSANPEPVRGTEAIAQDTEHWITAMPDMAIEIEELVVDGATVAMRLLFTGTHTGPLTSSAGEVPPTGRTVSVPMAVFNRNDENGLTEVEHRYLDLADMARQLGLA
ncbi:ester cyclase [Kocuria sp. LUK]|uniref:ester cyclase n=1 Tax=Kocuria TaxID=57493 RepID=UPI001E64B9A6|nr:ester cyclase [Kocuria sp. LUK]MCD1143926.1 ester cyclase [Kocuria sp. LUK]